MINPPSTAPIDQVVLWIYDSNMNEIASDATLSFKSNTPGDFKAKSEAFVLPPNALKT